MDLKIHRNNREPEKHEKPAQRAGRAFVNWAAADGSEGRFRGGSLYGVLVVIVVVFFKRGLRMFWLKREMFTKNVGVGEGN